MSEKCPETFYLAAAFTPNNDAKNDTWEAMLRYDKYKVIGL